MVRILGSEEDIKKTEERASALERLTRQSSDSDFLIFRAGNNIFVLGMRPAPLHQESYLDIDASMNLITVYNPFALRSAKRIAMSYEKENPQSEMMIRQDYSNFYALPSSAQQRSASRFSAISE